MSDNNTSTIARRMHTKISVTEPVAAHRPCCSSYPLQLTDRIRRSCDALLTIDAPNEAAAERAAQASNSASNKHKHHGKQQQQDSKLGKAKPASKKGKNQSANNQQPNTSTSTTSSTDSTTSNAAPSSSSSSSSSSTPSTFDVSPSYEPALLLHARLGDVKLSTIVTAAQAAKVHRQLGSIITAKASDGLASGGRGGAGEAEAEARSKERRKASAAKRKRQRDEREAKVTAGTASGGQVKRHKQEMKRRDGNKKAPRPASGSADSGTTDVEMNDAK